MINNLSEKEIKVRLLISEAARWLGTKEEKENSGAFIKMFQNWDNHPDQVPWCAAFVQYCLKMTLYTYDSLFQCCSDFHKAFPTEHCMTLWAKTDDKYKTQIPQEGSIVVWSHIKNGKPTGTGHCGIVTKAAPSQRFETIEGNTGDGSGINRDGDGVFARTRTLTGTEDFMVLGFILPFGD